MKNMLMGAWLDKFWCLFVQFHKCKRFVFTTGELFSKRFLGVTKVDLVINVELSFCEQVCHCTNVSFHFSSFSNGCCSFLML